MIIDGLGDDFIDDWFGLGRNAKGALNGREVKISTAPSHRNNGILAMVNNSRLKAKAFS